VRSLISYLFKMIASIAVVGLCLYINCTGSHFSRENRLQKVCESKGEYYYDAFSEACKRGFKP